MRYKVEPALNNVYFSVGGNGSNISGTYDRILIPRKNTFFVVGAGIGYNKIINGQTGLTLVHIGTPQPKQYTNPDALAFPTHFSFNVGSKKAYAEIGMGAVVYIGNNIEQNLYFFPLLGFRFEPFIKKKVMFRITGILPNSDGVHHTYWPIGASFGWNL